MLMNLKKELLDLFTILLRIKKEKIKKDY